MNQLKTTFNEDELSTMVHFDKKPIAKVFGSQIDRKALEELAQLSKRKGFLFSIGLPDLHAGNGIPVGHVTKFKKFVHYDIIGPDVGCLVWVEQLAKRHSSSVLDQAASFVQENFCSKEFPSIGGGNHFFEFAYDDAENQYIVFHTGSRSVGGEFYQMMKKELKLLDADAVHTDTKLFKTLHHEYMNAEGIAEWNVISMRAEIHRAFSMDSTISFLTRHNTIVENDGVVYHYKGASYAEPGVMVGIPLNMRDGTWIVETTPKIKDLFYSINHGAGRRLSRSEAKKQLTEADLEDICVRSNGDVLDEAPAAYKDIRSDMELLEKQGYIKILRKLTPILTVKA
jgi:release factor H-coupled RctB family protein